MHDPHSVMFITKRPEIEMISGNGSWLVDNNGKHYLDFMQGWAVNCLGHGNPGMIAALDAQARKVINHSLRQVAVTVIFHDTHRAMAFG